MEKTTERKLIDQKFGSNYIVFPKMYLGSFQGKSNKNDKAFASISFLTITKFKKGEVETAYFEDGKLPEICDKLILGDMIEVVIEFIDLNNYRIVDIPRKLSDSQLFKS